MQVLDGATDVRKQLLSMAPTSDMLLPMEALGEQVAVWCYSRDMEFCGSELLGIASLRGTAEKSSLRHVARTDFAALQKHVADTTKATSPPNVSAINTFVLSMTQADLDSCADNGVQWFFATVGENSLVYLPLGYYFTEKPLTSMVSGVHIGFVPRLEKNKPGFKATKKTLYSTIPYHRT